MYFPVRSVLYGTRTRTFVTTLGTRRVHGTFNLAASVHNMYTVLVIKSGFLLQRAMKDADVWEGQSYNGLDDTKEYIVVLKGDKIQRLKPPGPLVRP